MEPEFISLGTKISTFYNERKTHFNVLSPHLSASTPGGIKKNNNNAVLYFCSFEEKIIIGLFLFPCKLPRISRKVVNTFLSLQCVPFPFHAIIIRLLFIYNIATV